MVVSSEHLLHLARRLELREFDLLAYREAAREDLVRGRGRGRARVRVRLKVRVRVRVRVRGLRVRAKG